MTLVRRIPLILLLMIMLAGVVRAQEAAAPATSTATSTAAATTTTAAEPTSGVAAEQAAVARSRVQEGFSRVLGRHPRQVARILALDPTLLSNEPFLARYPELADFVAQNPDVRRNPHYFLRDYEGQLYERRPPAPFEDALEALSITAVFALIAFAIAWFVRTVIEQKRWNRLSRQQSEVHNKILDRFGSTAELLEYIKTPAGTKFLESAPIALHSERPAQNAPFSRVIWSVQIGVIVALGALGLLLVSFRFEKETAEGMFAMGAVAFCIGAGFIASALVSIFLSRRLGAWQQPPDSGRITIFDEGPVR